MESAKEIIERRVILPLADLDLVDEDDRRDELEHAFEGVGEELRLPLSAFSGEFGG